MPSGSFRTSMTRNRVGEDWPSKLTPIDLRVMLRPPSQPTRYRARMVFRVPSAEFDGRGDPVGVVDVAEQGVREVDVDVVEPRQPRQEFGVDQRLDEAVAPRPAEVLRAGRDVGQHLPRAVDHPHDVLRRGVRQDLLDDAGGLERAQRLVVQADPAGVVDQFLAGVGDRGGDAVPAEQVGQGEPDRAGADDQHVGVEGLGGGTVIGRGGESHR